MNRDQFILSSLLMLDEQGFVELKDPEPEKGKLGTVAVWTAALKSLTDDELQAGFNWAIENWTHAFNQKLSAGDIRKFVTEAQESNHGDLWREINSRKWDAVNGVFNRELGECVRYKFSPEAQQAIQQMGGIEVFLTMTTAQERQLFAQFRDIVTLNNKRAKEIAFSGPLLEAKKQQNNIIQLQAAKADLQERKAVKAEADSIDNATPIIEGIKAKFAKAQIEKQQLSREQRKAQLDAYIAEHGIEVQSLIPGEFWQDGQQELEGLDGKIESMASVLKGFKAI